MNKHIEQIARAICIEAEDDPDQHPHFGKGFGGIDTDHYVWENYIPEAKAAYQSTIRVLIERAEEEIEVTANTIVEAMCLRYFADRLKKQLGDEG